jgi:hypothetical protein
MQSFNKQPEDTMGAEDPFIDPPRVSPPGMGEVMLIFRKFE